MEGVDDAHVEFVDIAEPNAISELYYTFSTRAGNEAADLTVPAHFEIDSSVKGDDPVRSASPASPYPRLARALICGDHIR